MLNFYYDTDKKLVEIFTEHCNLSGEQYEWIRGEMIYLVCDIQEAEPQAEIEKRIHKMEIVFDFLLETDELTLKEHADLYDMTADIWEEGKKAAVEAALMNGRVL